jgi:1,4-dihydroxy-2-naphthoate octaprenyltransferase
MAQTKTWIQAARLRTLPLALGVIGMPAFLAVLDGVFDVMVFLLTLITALLLQILSNLANDYGDSVHGADSASRVGPSRTVQSGLITKSAMKKAVFLFAFLSLVSGLGLIYYTLDGTAFILFLSLGVGSILAAIAYTNGKRPYGYAGLGDLFVFLFFGWVAVIGGYYLYQNTFYPALFLPGSAVGLFSVGVLNINNIRDIESDKEAGKLSIPVRLGRDGAIAYHFFLVFGPYLLMTLFTLFHYQSVWQLAFWFSFPLAIANYSAVRGIDNPKMLDPYLKQMALTTLGFVFSFGLGIGVIIWFQ